MITEIKGDLLSVDADIICHQTNFYGVMGGGIALAIKNYALPSASFSAYQQHCKKRKSGLLGTVQYLPGANRNGYMCVVANLFCQGGSLRHGCVLTCYDHMRTCLETVERDVRACNEVRNAPPMTVALPGYMGCGIAGGDWQTVRQIIEDVFGQSPVSLTIVHWDRGS